MKNKPISEVTNEDNMIMMSRYPDKFFDLAIVDPPYGIGFGKFNRTNKNSDGKRYKANKYHTSDWDNNIPPPEYFNELKRVSKNQIIWGGNYFPMLWEEGCKGFIFWFKHQPVNNFADGEFAWSSFNMVAKCFDYPYYGNINAENRLHPTQKPIALYDWLLKNYAKEGDKILDTHLGSGSSRISAYKNGFDFWGCEIDKDYFEASEARFNEYFKYEIDLNHNLF